MITINNYAKDIEQYDNFEKSLPANLKAGHNYVTEYGDLYNDDAEIKDTIDLYLRKLNEFLKVASPYKSEDETANRLKETHARVQQQKKEMKEKLSNLKKPEHFTNRSQILPNQVVIWEPEDSKKITVLIRGNGSHSFSTPNRKSFVNPPLRSLRAPKPEEQELVNKAIEEAFRPEFVKTHPQYKYEYSEAKNPFGHCQTLDKDGKPDISADSIKKLESCTEDLIQTKILTQENGKYTPARQKIHDEIVASFKKDKPCVQQREPVAVLTGGPPGSGKTTWLKKYAKWITGKNVYHIDADEVRAKLPEYKGWNATQTHLETKDIVNQLIDDIGVPCEFDLVYDGTMNKAESYEPLVNKLRKLGYKIFIIYISVPKEVSEKRVLERYRKHGRYVPQVVIDEVYERGLSAFEKLTKEADGFIRVDGVSGKLLEKGGMPIPKKERYQKRKGDEPCHTCDEHKKRETHEEVELRHKNAEQFIKDLEAQPDKLKAMSEEHIIELGLQFEKTYRTASSQTRDESHDGKKRLSPTPENLIRWMKHPGQFDLIGVDSFERKDATSNYKREISIQKFWHNLFNIKIKV